jgi:hypothetical protein
VRELHGWPRMVGGGSCAWERWRSVDYLDRCVVAYRLCSRWAVLRAGVRVGGGEPPPVCGYGRCARGGPSSGSQSVSGSCHLTPLALRFRRGRPSSASSVSSSSSYTSLAHCSGSCARLTHLMNLQRPQAVRLFPQSLHPCRRLSWMMPASAAVLATMSRNVVVPRYSPARCCGR